MEVIRFGVENSRPPLLFVHGSYCGAWIWTKNFLPAFANAQWWGAAISLRGHGGSGGMARINTFGIAEYLEDIRIGTRLFDRPPVLVGHSLGGYLVQKYALDHPVAGLVLLSSPSLLGLHGSTQHIALKRPALAAQLGVLMAFGPTRTDFRVITDALFADQKTAREVEHSLPRLQSESSRLVLEASYPDFRTPVRDVPTLVVGGDKDAFVPEFDFWYEAQTWQAKCRVLPNVPHGVMLDPCWPVVADEVFKWLEPLR